MELIEEKIQLIAKEIQESNASTWTITKVIKELNGLNTKNETKLREHALKILKKMDPNAAKIYEIFSKMKVYTSRETIENFNRGQIIQSLIKETNISRNVAEKITLEVENEIKDSKIEILTASLIRELVNAKLIFYGFEKIRNQYTRIGFPAHEIEKKLNIKPYIGEETKEFILLNVLPKDALKLHYEGKIFIEDIGGFSNRPFSYSFIAEKETTLNKTIITNTKKLLKYNNFFSLPPNICGMSFVTAEFLKSENNAKKISKKINDYFSLIENDFSNYLELFTPNYLEEFSDNRIKAAAITNHLSNNKNTIIGVDSKYCLKLIETSKKEFTLLNNSDEEIISLNKKFFSQTKGIDLFININIEKLADNEDDIIKELQEISQLIQKLKIKKQKLLLEKKYLNEFNINTMKTAIGISGFFHLEENLNLENKDFFKKITKELKKTFKDELIFPLASKNAKDKFSGTIGKEVFSNKNLNFKECLNEKNICFLANATNLKELGELIENKVKLIKFKKN